MIGIEIPLKSKRIYMKRLDKTFNRFHRSPFRYEQPRASIPKLLVQTSQAVQKEAQIVRPCTPGVQEVWIEHEKGDEVLVGFHSFPKSFVVVDTKASPEPV